MSELFNVAELKSVIARQRFPFPNKDKPAWRTYVNDGDNPLAALPAEDGEIYPDILVIDRATMTNKHLMAASVCLKEPSPENIILWRRISNVVDFFYVFVPEEHCRRAAELAVSGNIQVSGFRSFSHDDGSIKIKDCF